MGAEAVTWVAHPAPSPPFIHLRSNPTLSNSVRGPAPRAVFLTIEALSSEV